MARIVLLGTGTCQIEPGRAASSVLIELGGARLVFDMGRGVADRLATLGLRQDDLEHIVVSHFHADHVSDLVPYLQAGSYSRSDPRSQDLSLWGPPGLRRLVEGWLDLFGAENLVKPGAFAVEVREIGPGPVTIAGHRFEIASLPPAGNQGLAFEHGGRRCVLTGDSSFHAKEIDFLRGAEIAVFDSGHLSEDEILELAVATRVDRLVCSHLYRDLDEDALNARAADAGYRGRLIVGRDGLELVL